MTTQAEKGQRFAALHEEGCFVIPNPWDSGSARLLASLGFKALATTSAGFAFTQGLPDTVPDRNAVLTNARTIVEATDLPVSADLVDGFGLSPGAVADTVREAAAVGLVGCSIEDAIPGRVDPFLPIDEAAARVAAAVDAAKALPFRFTLTARADNYFHGRQDLDDTISRLKAYAAAGADVLYAPAVTDPDEIKTLIAAVDRPVNVLSGIGGNSLTVADFASLGARRISVGSTLWGIAHAAVREAALTLLEGGGFDAFSKGLSYPETNALFSQGNEEG